MQGMAWKHSISMNQYRPPSSEETQNCSQSTKPTTIARPLCPNTIAHFHWTFRSIVKFLHHFLPQLPSYKGHHGCCCIEMLKYWWKSQNLDSSVPCTSHIGKVDDGWCIYIDIYWLLQGKIIQNVSMSIQEASHLWCFVSGLLRPVSQSTRRCHVMPSITAVQTCENCGTPLNF